MVKRQTTHHPSEYCLFHMALEGYDLYSRITGKKFLKVAVWNEYKDDSGQLELIKSMFHPDFRFEKNENHPLKR